MYKLLPNSIIPPKEQIVAYADSLLADTDYCCEAYGYIALNAINAFIDKYPDVPELLRKKAICLAQLGQSLFFISLFQKNETKESNYVSELESLVLEYQKVPENARTLCSYLYTRAFTCITSNHEIQKSYVKVLSDLLTKIQDNQHIQNYLANGIQSICETTYDEKTIDKYFTILKELSEKYNNNDKVVLAYSAVCLLKLHCENTVGIKQKLFSEIEMIYEQHFDFHNLLCVKIFALLYLAVEDEQNRRKYVNHLSRLAKEYSNLSEILGKFEWNTHYEHFCGLNKNMMYYCDNMRQIIELYPDFPDFVICHKEIFLGLINVNGKAPYREDFFNIIQAAAERCPDRDDIQLLYGECLMHMSHWESDKGAYFELLESLSEKFSDSTSFIGFYFKSLGNIFSYKKTEDYKKYLSVVEDAYQKYQDLEYVCEAYVMATGSLVGEDTYHRKYPETENKREFSKEGDAEKYFPEIKKIANRFPKNHNIAENYLCKLDDMLDIYDSEDFYDEAKEEAIWFSYIYPDDWGDTTYSCYKVLERYFLGCTDYEKQEKCFVEMNRIIDGWRPENRGWYIAETLMEMINKQKNEMDKERFWQMLKTHCAENPDSLDSVWRYGEALNVKIRTLNPIEEKEFVFNELEQWVLSHPGNPYLLAEYADGLLSLADFLFNENQENDYVIKLKTFASQYPTIMHESEIEKKSSYKRIVGGKND